MKRRPGATGAPDNDAPRSDTGQREAGTVANDEHEGHPRAAVVKDLFERFIRENQLKHTAQRLKIVKRAFSMPRHFSAEDLYQILKRDKTYVSKATVYRTLKLLVDANFLDELEIGARQAKIYEPVHGREHHDHMICLRCGRILEFTDPKIEAHQELAAARHRFRVLSHSLKLFGLCAECGASDAEAGEASAGS